MPETEVTINQLFEEIVRNRNELKNSIESSEIRVLLKIETLSNKVNILEKENQELRDKIELLERNSKKNNLVIFGLNRNTSDITTQLVCAEVKRLLDIDLFESDLNNVYPLGQTENSPIKIELISQTKKQNILKNCHKLKGLNIFISNDLTAIQRTENNILRKHLQEARKNTENRCFIKGNKLIVNNTAYTAKDLETSENFSDKKATDTPSTVESHPLSSTKDIFISTKDSEFQASVKALQHSDSEQNIRETFGTGEKSTKTADLVSTPKTGPTRKQKPNAAAATAKDRIKTRSIK